MKRNKQFYLIKKWTWLVWAWGLIEKLKAIKTNFKICTWTFFLKVQQIESESILVSYALPFINELHSPWEKIDACTTFKKNLIASLDVTWMHWISWNHFNLMQSTGSRSRILSEFFGSMRLVIYWSEGIADTTHKKIDRVAKHVLLVRKIEQFTLLCEQTRLNWCSADHKYHN